jgi:hypothetical protein
VYRRYKNIYIIDRYCGIPLEAAPTSVRGQISSDLSLEVVYTKHTYILERIKNLALSSLPLYDREREIIFYLT